MTEREESPVVADFHSFASATQEYGISLDIIIFVRKVYEYASAVVKS